MQRHFLVRVFIIIIITKHKSCIVRDDLSCVVISHIFNSTKCGYLLPFGIIYRHYSFSIILVFVCSLEGERYSTQKNRTIDAAAKLEVSLMRRDVDNTATPSNIVGLGMFCGV